MNNAGLPGTGLGGVFYLLLAAAMPVVELVRTLQGRSSAARWRVVGLQLALACGIVAATVATMVGYVRLAGIPSPFGLDGPVVVLAPAVLAVLLLGVLLVTVRLWARLTPGRSTVPRPSSVAGRHRRDRDDQRCRSAGLRDLVDRRPPIPINPSTDK